MMARLPRCSLFNLPFSTISFTGSVIKSQRIGNCSCRLVCVFSRRIGQNRLSVIQNRYFYGQVEETPRILSCKCCMSSHQIRWDYVSRVLELFGCKTVNFFNRYNNGFQLCYTTYMLFVCRLIAFLQCKIALKRYLTRHVMQHIHASYLLQINIIENIIKAIILQTNRLSSSSNY